MTEKNDEFEKRLDHLENAVHEIQQLLIKHGAAFEILSLIKTNKKSNV